MKIHDKPIDNSGDPQILVAKDFQGDLWLRYEYDERGLMKINNMKYTLTCNNGKEIDMTSYIIQQSENKITRQDVLNRIEFYKSTNQ